MVEIMKPAFLMMALSVAAAAGAQTVQDPTRPPAQLLRSVAAAPVSSAPQLQSILIGRAAGGRRIAVIDGDTVRVGDLVHGARVLGIGPSEVVLQRGAQRTILKWTAQAAPIPAPAAPGKPE
jgi:MSHA biogenesis protein MshK